jgi:ABC-2 type transport system ATP-binding protein
MGRLMAPTPPEGLLTVASARTGATSTEEVVRTEQLTKVYRGAPSRGPRGDQRAAGTQELVAVDHLNLSVRRGEIFGLLGPNGAGKSTTIGILTTRVLPTSGTAVVAGVDVVRAPARAKRRIGVVSQTNTLDRSLSVRDNLFYHGRYFGLSRRESARRADELLERFRLADRAAAPVLALSGGMAQRLMVARAILHEPEVLFLDEPTAGLDPQSRLALWDLVRDLHARGQTVVLTTHYMEEADQLCERLAIIDHGRILAEDAPGELKRTLGERSEIRLSVAGDAPAAAERITQALGAERAEVLALDGTVRCLVRDAGSVLPVVVAEANQVAKVTNVAVEEPTLESVFIRLTGRDLRE